jgi:hypothetical protein
MDLWRERNLISNLKGDFENLLTSIDAGSNVETGLCSDHFVSLNLDTESSVLSSRRQKGENTSLIQGCAAIGGARTHPFCAPGI